ncbi:hypothetical protein D9613_012044 [Agrocybe pediades]|uniref:CCHC-type domain-containing protein n=1 Tax=Agrocybe pediades TaxID=84607 RepID=A0A8H4VJ26_9AGAR|nr:hypothetical protein D9613_012044 [Agrocybe pediades]
MSQPTATPTTPAATPVMVKTATKPYPARGTKEAPVFDGHRTPIQRYLEDIKELCNYRGDTSDKVKYDKAIWYVDMRFVDSWKRIMSPTATWEENKKSLLESFPGLDSLYKYSINDMNNLVTTYSSKPMNKLEDVAEYHCEFMVIATFSLDEKLITQDNVDRKYIMGLPEAFRARVSAQLIAENPTRKPGLPVPLLDVNRAARHVLQDNVYNTGPSSALQIQEIKKEVSSEVMGSMLQMQQALTLIQKKMDEGRYEPSNWTYRQPQPYMGNRNYQDYPQRDQRSYGCNFCGANGHFMRECLESKKYLDEGRYRLTPNNKIVNPDGSWPTGPGTIKERLDAYRGGNHTRDLPPHLASTMMFECTANIQDTFTATLEEVEADEEAEVFKLVTRSEAGDTPRKPGPGRNSEGFKGSKPEVVIEKPVSKPLTPVSPKQSVRFVEKATMEPRNPSQLQYKFFLGIESPALVKTVIEKSLKSLVTLTQQELLAAAPDLRRYYKDQTITRKIPTVGILKADDSEITADDTLSSHSVKALVLKAKKKYKPVAKKVHSIR